VKQERPAEGRSFSRAQGADDDPPTQPPDSPGAKAQARAAGNKIPDKPRDCGPNVDTWPILDEPARDAPKSKAGANSAPKPTG
jgi:hypothetical protein